MHRSARHSNTRTKINLPAGDHNAVLRSAPHDEMVTTWDELTNQYERMVMETYGVRKHPVAEVAPVIAYASVSRVSRSLCSAAAIASGVFDPVEFGQSCERIAREQIERYRIHHEKAGRPVSSPVT